MKESDIGAKSTFPAAEGSKPECDAALEGALLALTETVAEAGELFLQIDPFLFDGYQTAVEVLSHLLYWHREYVGIIRALRKGEQPQLRVGTFAELNEAAVKKFASVPVDELVNQLLAQHRTFQHELKLLEDFSVEFPIKYGGRTKSIMDRILSIDSHIRNHVRRLKSAERHGEAWVKAYYQEQ